MIKKNFFKDVCFLTFSELLKYPFIKHAFSTKIGGVSSKEFSSMNLSFGRGDNDENVIENYHKICDACGFDYNSLVASYQVHGTNIMSVTKKDCGKGIYKNKFTKGVDGLITNKKGVTLVTYFADCVPLYFIDIKKKVIALSHAGWRGTVNLIGAKTVQKMQKEYDSDISDIICAIGPSIGPCCFEVNEDVKKEFEKLNLDNSLIIKNFSNGKYAIDLWSANKQILLSCGISERNIIAGNMCTACNNDILFSHRVTNGKRGGMAAFLCLK